MLTNSFKSGTSYTLELCRPFACGHSPCEFMCMSVLLFVQGLDSLVSSVRTGSYNLSAFSSSEFLEPRKEGFDDCIPFYIECSKVSHFLNTATVDHCICSCLLQEEAALLMGEQDTGLGSLTECY